MATLTDINGIGPALAKRLAAKGFTTVNAVASATPAALAEVQGLSAKTAASLVAEAKKAGGQAKAAAVAAATAGGGASSADKSRATPDTEPDAKRDGETLGNEIDELRTGLAKLEKRLAKLEQGEAPKTKKSKNGKKKKKKRK